MSPYTDDPYEHPSTLWYWLGLAIVLGAMLGTGVVIAIVNHGAPPTHAAYVPPEPK